MIIHTKNDDKKQWRFFNYTAAKNRLLKVMQYDHQVFWHLKTIINASDEILNPISYTPLLGYQSF